MSRGQGLGGLGQREMMQGQSSQRLVGLGQQQGALQGLRGQQSVLGQWHNNIGLAQQQNANMANDLRNQNANMAEALRNNNAQMHGLFDLPMRPPPKPELPKHYNDMDYKQFNTLYGRDRDSFINVAIKCSVKNMKVSDYMRKYFPMEYKPKFVESADLEVSQIQLKNEYLPVVYDKYRSFFGLDVSYRLCMLIIKWSK